MNNEPQNNLLLQTEYSAYQLTEHILGTGAFGVVRIGVDMITQQQVAVKIMPVDYLQQAQNQIKILKLLNQDNTSKQQWNPIDEKQEKLHIYGSYRSYNSVYIVTQLFGVSLTAFMHQINRTDFAAVFCVFKSIIQALKTLRKRRILHRDLKPDNILIKMCKQKKFYTVKLCDFGLSAVQSNSTSAFIDCQRVGTLIYQSPQVIKFKEYSEKSEIWSLGIILYELIYNKLPFQKSQMLTKDVFYQNLMAKSIKFNGVPKLIAQIGQKCLAINSNKRIGFNDLSSMVNQFIVSSIALKQTKQIQANHKYQQMTKERQQQQPSFQSSLSTKEISIKSSTSAGRKFSEEMFEYQQTSDFFKMLCQAFKILKQKYQKLKRSTKCVSPLLKLCQKIEDQQLSQLSLINTQNFNILIQIFGKMKLMCQFSENQKQISYNLNEFMFTDCLLLIIDIFKSRLHNWNNNSLTKLTKQLSSYIKQSNCAKQMKYYRQLRITVLNWQ